MTTDRIPDVADLDTKEQVARAIGMMDWPARKQRVDRCHQTAASMLTAMTGTALATDPAAIKPVTVIWTAEAQRTYLEEAYLEQFYMISDMIGHTVTRVPPEEFIMLVVGYMRYDEFLGAWLESVVLLNRLSALRETGLVTLAPDGWIEQWTDPRATIEGLSEQARDRQGRLGMTN